MRSWWLKSGWHWADARIDGDSVVCSHPDAEEPITIRYAFRMNPAGANLYPNRARYSRTCNFFRVLSELM